MRVSQLGLVVALSAMTLPIATPLLAQEAAAVSPSVENIDPIAAAKSRASLLWTHDQAAWHSTDVMLAQQKRANKDQRAALTTVRGWVVTADAKGWLVVYYAPAAVEGEAPQAVFSAIWMGEGAKVTDAKWHVGQSYAWSEEQLALIQAANLVPMPVLGCTRANLNRVIMPDPAVQGQILVYFMTPQEKTNMIPFGRHSRTAIKDGAVVDRFNATKGCLILPSAGPDGEKPPAMGVSNFTAATPTEFHLFASRTAGLPVVTMDQQDKPNYIVGWRGGEPYIEPISDIQDIGKYVD